MSFDYICLIMQIEGRQHELLPVSLVEMGD